MSPQLPSAMIQILLCSFDDYIQLCGYNYSNPISLLHVVAMFQHSAPANIPADGSVTMSDSPQAFYWLMSL